MYVYVCNLIYVVFISGVYFARINGPKMARHLSAMAMRILVNSMVILVRNVGKARGVSKK